MASIINAALSGGLTTSADTSGILQLQTASITAVTVDASQRLGIGTTSPAVKLDVVGASTTGLRLRSSSGASNGFNLYNDSTNDIAYLTNFYNGPMVFGTNNTERMRLDNSGNLGIGTSSPSAKLHVEGGTENAIIGSSTRKLYFRADSNGVSVLDAAGQTGNGFYVNSASSHVATFTGSTERMRIDSSGNLLVGTTTTTGSASNTRIVAGGIFKTVSGSVSAATSTATTLFTVQAGLAAYLVTVNVDADTTIYSATYLINTQGGSSTVATQIFKGANISVSVSGYDVRATQTSGAAATIQYSAVRIF